MTEGAAGVEERSAELRKELRLGDLVLAQIVLIVGATWVGVAGRLGPANLVYWLLAAALFFVPLAAVVVFLNDCWALEGGLYQWAKLAFGGACGFLVGWNLWLWAIVNLASMGLEISTALSYAAGPAGAWMATSRPFIAGMTVAVVGALALAAALGLRVGKWIHNAGGALGIATYTVLILLPVACLLAGAHVDWHPARLTSPPTSLFSLDVLGKMGFGAFSGFEYVAIFAGESRGASRAIRRSVWIAAPVVVAMFVLGTSGVLAFSRPEDIDLIAPVPQAVALGTRALHGFSWLATAASIAIAFRAVAWGSAAFAGMSRLPMVAGWDGLLPAAFTRLHPRFKTPLGSVAFLAAVALVLGLLGMLGVGTQEAWQLFLNACLVFYALTYMVMFAIPIVAPRTLPRRPGLLLRVLCVSGFAMTVLFVALSGAPIVQVASRGAFTAKIVAITVVANAVGVALWVAAKRRARAAVERT
ncbi:MAG TPA: APC family permease [Polyangiaceae bacterium]